MTSSMHHTPHNEISIKSIKKLNSNWINLDPVSITVEMVHTSLQILAAEDLATLRQIAR